MTASAEAHPAYAPCFRIYRNALVDWHGSEAIQEASRTLGMTCRDYCDSRLVSNQFSWASTSTSEPFTNELADAAYSAAVDEVCGVRPSFPREEQQR